MLDMLDNVRYVIYQIPDAEPRWDKSTSQSPGKTKTKTLTSCAASKWIQIFFSSFFHLLLIAVLGAEVVLTWNMSVLPPQNKYINDKQQKSRSFIYLLCDCRLMPCYKKHQKRDTDIYLAQIYTLQRIRICCCGYSYLLTNRPAGLPWEKKWSEGR